MFIELHMLQNFAPSNLNRDDTNNPKDCVFGGVRRARISSQCLKSAIRNSDIFIGYGKTSIGKRSRWICRKIVVKLVELGHPVDEAENVTQVLLAEMIGNMEMDKKTEKYRNKVIFYFSDEELEMCVNFIQANYDAMLVELGKISNIGKYIEKIPDKQKNQKFNKYTKQIVKEIESSSHQDAVDIALFGRMLASNPILNVNAACQVAHAISTHRVAMELDFFTAVDDLLQEDESGAGMMGVTAYNSACFYRYACIDFQQLVKNLNGDVGLARSTVEAFLNAAIFAIPSGKQNSFAAHNPPHLMLAVMHDKGQCLSLANAFEKPVYATQEHSLLQASVAALDDYWGKMNAFFGSLGRPVTAVLDDDVELKSLQESRVPDFSQWMQEVMNGLPQE